MSHQASRSPSEPPEPSVSSSSDSSDDDLGPGEDYGPSVSRGGSPNADMNVDGLVPEEDTVPCRWRDCNMAFTQLRGLIDHIHNGPSLLSCSTASDAEFHALQTMLARTRATTRASGRHVREEVWHRLHGSHSSPTCARIPARSRSSALAQVSYRLLYQPLFLSGPFIFRYHVPSFGHFSSERYGLPPF
jgi:hypothetical protein